MLQLLRFFRNQGFADKALRIIMDQLMEEPSQGAAPLEIPSRAILDGIQKYHAALGDLGVRSQEPEEESQNDRIGKNHFADRFQTGNWEPFSNYLSTRIHA